jgi:hypothetical protein
MEPIWNGKIALNIMQRLKRCLQRPMQKECVYCRTTTGSFKNGEHVIPKAFGTFGKQTWVLHGCVCDACNSYFGDNLEVYFNRSSFEGLERFKHGKPRAEATGIHLNRVTVVSASPQSKGMKFTPVSHQLIPQVGLLLAGKTDRDFFSIEEVEGMPIIDNSKYDLKNPEGILIITRDKESYDRFATALIKLGVDFAKQREASLPGSHIIELDYAVKCDALNLRTIAKIALNYMAKVRGPAYCLRADFDPIRDYIRNGVRPPFTPVVPSNSPILAYDTETKRQTSGHIIVLESKDNGGTIQARVSLYNAVTYTVTLAKYFSNAISLPNVGHHFDFEQKTMNPLWTGKKGSSGFAVRKT